MSIQNSETQNTNKPSFPALGPVAARAAVAALVIGSVLTAINQPGAVFGDVAFQKFPLGAVFVTPFLVVCLSQVLGFRAARRALARDGNEHHEGSFFQTPFLQTMTKHGIPGRSVLLGLGAGGVNTILAGSVTQQSGGGLDQLPLPLVLQSLILPMVFGALSQTLSFRREIGTQAETSPVETGTVVDKPSLLRAIGGRLSALEDALHEDPAAEVRRRVGVLESQVNSADRRPVERA
jgi:hypothetical protein